MKKVLLVLLGISFILLAGCEVNPEREAEKQAEKVNKVLDSWVFTSNVGSDVCPLTEGQKMVLKMGLGWNLGNTLDAYGEGKTGLGTENYWGQPTTTKEMIDGLVAGGIKTIRIPVTWHNHFSDDKYTIDSAWMDRVKTIVDWAIEDGMFVILNIHHDDAYYTEEAIGYNDGFYPLEKDRAESEKFLTAVWTQVGNTFKSYDEKLIFETMNEPRLRAGRDGSYPCASGNHEWWLNSDCPTCLEAEQVLLSYNQLCINTIRATGGNNAEIRYISCPNLCASPDAAFHYTKYIEGDYKNSKTMIELLEDSVENHLIQSVHMYTPYSFAMETPGESKFTQKHESDLQYYFKNLLYFIDKGYPVIIGETGATDKNNLMERANWYACFTGYAKSISATCCIWDNGYTTPGSEAYGFYDRNNQEWEYPLLKDVAVEQTKITEELILNNIN